MECLSWVILSQLDASVRLLYIEEPAQYRTGTLWIAATLRRAEFNLCRRQWRLFLSFAISSR